MKKLAAAILVFDIIMGVVLLCVYGRGRHMSAAMAIFSGTEKVENREEDEVQKKIAFPFDDGPHAHYTE